MMIANSTKAFLGAALLAASNAVFASALHYEKPPCGSDEKAVQLMGVDGVFCSPQCNPGCPIDAPDGVTATPTCALQSPDGGKFCAILCQPSDGDDEHFRGDSECGSEMSCASIPGSGGFGVCVYPMSSQGVRRSPLVDQLVFGITE